MNLFTPKFKRVAQHRDLLATAKVTVERLKIKGRARKDDTTIPDLSDPAWEEVVPLEYRWWLSWHMETLVSHVHDITEPELGKRGLMQELAESVNAARAVLAGMPDSIRDRFRAETFARLQRNLDSYISEISRSLVTEDHIGLVYDGDALAKCLANAKIALTWFPNHEALKAADALRKKADKELPKPSLLEMQRLINEGEPVLRKVRNFKANRTARPT